VGCEKKRKGAIHSFLERKEKNITCPSSPTDEEGPIFLSSPERVRTVPDQIEIKKEVSFHYKTLNGKTDSPGLGKKKGNPSIPPKEGQGMRRG